MGNVYLVGAGPGDPELLTLKAARLLANADVVLHDSLVGEGVLALIGKQANVVDVGKRCGTKLLTQDEINALVIAYAEQGGVVVRLKGGDPTLFGRAGEEIAALREAGVPYEIVPGITAALGSAAAAGISLTDRHCASQVLFTTFSRKPGNCGLDWGVIGAKTTVAIYMPGADYGEVAARLLDAGVSANTPCVIVSQASGPEQKLRWLEVEALYEAERLPAPALLIVGKVASRAAHQADAGIVLDILAKARAFEAELDGWSRN